jgi:anti-sigma B factor antagonist
MPLFRRLGVWKEGDVVIVRFGEHRNLDERAIDKIGDELYALADHPDCLKLLLNFASVIGLSSLMLGKLLMLGNKMQRKGGQLKLCEVGPEVQDVFDSTKLSRILDICQSEADGLAAFATADA